MRQVQWTLRCLRRRKESDVPRVPFMNVEFPTVADAVVADGLADRTGRRLNHSCAVTKSGVSSGKMGSENHSGQVPAFCVGRWLRLPS